MSSLMRLRVVGLPTPQGSKSAFRNPHTGKISMVEGKGAATARHKAWRAAVAESAASWAAAHDLPAPLDEPVRVRCVFWLPRPASKPKWKWLPDRKPDVDKLARSTLDALAGVLICDDSRVVELAVRKLYAIGTTPGALIVVEPLGSIERERGHAWAITGGAPPTL